MEEVDVEHAHFDLIINSMMIEQDASVWMDSKFLMVSAKGWQQHQNLNLSQLHLLNFKKEIHSLQREIVAQQILEKLDNHSFLIQIPNPLPQKLPQKFLR